MKRIDDRTSVIASVDQRVESSEIGRVLDEFLVALEAGDDVDPQSLLDRYPEWAAALSPALQQLVALHGVSRDLESDQRDGSGEFDAVRHTLGDFRILREIGRGGMGVVYEAEQISLGRRVALKVLPLAAVLDERHLTRFKNEARAAATLNHPNIVPVYAVGCERGVHYYAMQYIEGQSLAQVITALRAQNRFRDARAGERSSVEPQEVGDGSHGCAPSPVVSPARAPHLLETRSDTSLVAKAPELSNARASQIDERTADDTAALDALVTLLTEHRTKPARYFYSIAHLGVRIAEALEHAHQNGVVHRDVKPANLLLDSTGNVWVADFGLARLESDAGVTMTGGIVGTLQYMSPEQALAKRGVIDQRTDVYSLGATLYELTTLRPVFDGDSRQDVLRQIALDSPQSPRKWNRDVPSELETILLKALAKSPDERYSSAQEMADDLRRLIENKPILARRPSVSDRATKWAKRHRGWVVAFGVTMVALTIGSFAAALSINRALQSEMEQRIRADENLNASRQHLDRAKRNFAIASKALDEMYLSLATEELPTRKELSANERKIVRGLLSQYEILVEANRLEDPSSSYADHANPVALRASSELLHDGNSARSLGLHRQTLAKFNRLCGLSAESQTALHSACRAYERAIELAWPSPTPAVQWMRELRALAQELVIQEEPERAIAFYRRATECGRKWVSEIHAARDRSDADDTQSAYREVFELHIELAELLDRRGESEHARLVFRDGWSLPKTVAFDSPVFPQSHMMDLISSNVNLRREMIGLLQAEIDTMRALRRSSSADIDQRQFRRVCHAFQLILINSPYALDEDEDLAIAVMEEALAIDKDGPPFASLPEYDQRAVYALLSHLADALSIHSQPSHRNPARALELAQQRSRLRSGPASDATRTLGIALFRNGQMKEAVDIFEVSVSGRTGESKHLFCWAMALWQLGEHDAARHRFGQAIVTARKEPFYSHRLENLRNEARTLLESNDSEQGPLMSNLNASPTSQ